MWIDSGRNHFFRFSDAPEENDFWVGGTRIGLMGRMRLMSIWVNKV